MKGLLTGFAVILVAAVWMTGSWFFFNTLAVGDQEHGAPPVANDKEGSAEGPHWNGCHPGLLKNLDLTDTQKEQVKAITFEENSIIKPLVQQLRGGREQFDSLRKSGPFDEAKVRAIAKGQADTLIELTVARERVKSRIYALLTPEQRAKAEKLREDWKAQQEKGSKHRESQSQ